MISRVAKDLGILQKLGFHLKKGFSNGTFPYKSKLVRWMSQKIALVEAVKNDMSIKEVIASMTSNKI